MMDLNLYIEEIDRGYHTFREVCSLADKWAIEKTLLEMYDNNTISENALNALIQLQLDCIKTGKRTFENVPIQLKDIVREKMDK